MTNDTSYTKTNLLLLILYFGLILQLGLHDYWVDNYIDSGVHGWTFSPFVCVCVWGGGGGGGYLSWTLGPTSAIEFGSDCDNAR